MRPRPLLLLGLLLGFPAAGPALALDPGRAITQYRLDAWTANEGLPQNSVESIAQTPDGYLWFGTQEGLARFDGVSFTVFDRSNTPELPHNRILALELDGAGTLWIGTDGGGLTRLSRGRFARFGHGNLPGNRLRAIAAGSDGAVWVAPDRGLLRIAPGAEEAVPVLELAGVVVACLAPASGGDLWIGTSAGLKRLHAGKVLVPEGAPAVPVVALLAARDGDVYCGLEGSVVERFGRSPARWGREQGIDGGIRTLLQDRDGRLWIAAGSGLHRVSGERVDRLPRGGDLLHGLLQTLFEDREGSLWIGIQDEGLRRLADATFVPWGVREGLSGDIVSPILETQDGSLWIGTRGGGLNRLKDGRVVAVIGARELGSADVQSLLEDREGTLWVGTREGGLARLRDGRVVSRLTVKEGLAGNSVRSLCETPDGAIWVGGASGKLQRFEKGAFTTFDVRSGLPPHEIFFILAGHGGALLLATNGGGLVRYQGGAFRAITTKDGLSGDIVNTLHEEPDGTLWVGTYGGGLNRIRNGRIASITTREGLYDDAVFRILDDDHGSFWISCNKGVYRVEKRELDDVAEGRSRKIRCVPFGTADGMRNRECNGAEQPVGWKTRDGRLFFPTIEGAVSVDPARIRRNTVPPPVVIEEVLRDGASLPPGASPSLAPGVRRLEFRYAALSFLVPERVRFRYRLEGFDPDWVEAGTRRTAYYTNVPPGDHVFHVLACNDSGVWNTAGARFPFRVRPFFRQTIWFWLLSAGALGAAVAATTRVRLARLTAQKQALQSLVDEKVRELSRAEAKIAALSESDPAKIENVSGWASSFAGEIAQMIGVRAIGVFKLDGSEFRALTPDGSRPPPPASIREKGRGFPRGDDQVYVPVNGMTGELRGVLSVEGAGIGSGWTDSQRRLVLGFAQHLGGALELLDLRERLTAAAKERERTRRRMEEEGVATVVVCPTCRACYPETESACAKDGAALDRSRLLPLRILGRYRLSVLLGEGGMGIVFAAHDEELDREVAVKVIRPEQLSDAGGRLRLEREARAIARIRHPGVVALHDAQELPDGSACLVMELLRGLDLAQVLVRFGPGSPRQVGELARQAGAALTAAHRAGVVHRDVKPANVFLELGPEGMKVKVVDFGLAISEGAGDRLTKTGMVVGTPLYMSPEQVRGGKLDARSDLFSLAAVLFEALTGRSPFEGGDTARVWLRIVGEDPPKASELVAGLSPTADALFSEALARDAERRPASTEEWGRRLADALAGSGESPLRRWPEQLGGEALS